MSYLTEHLDEQLKDIRTTIAEALGKLESPTQEMVEKTVRDLHPSSWNDARALIPFSGYYGLNSPAGAFLSIYTTKWYINWPNTQSFSFPIIAINVSLDGITSTSYPFNSSASFDGHTLTIPDVLSVKLEREYVDGKLVKLSGMINNNPVLGSTHFNPVGLPVFNGTYKEPTTNTPKLTVANSSLQFDSGNGLQNISIFTYDPAMFVITFVDSLLTPYALMLGSATSFGFACCILHGTSTSFVFTIPPVL